MRLAVMSRWWRRGRTHEVLSGRAAYEVWAGSYPAIAHNPLMRVEQAVLEPILARAAAKTALDVGTGSGRYLPVLARAGARRIVGVDRSLAMLARHQLGFPRTCGDARSLPFRTGTFDLVMSSLMAGDIDDLGACVAELARVVKPGGCLVYSDFHPSWSERGWRRTFTVEGGRAIDLPFCAHTMDDHLAALDRARLRVCAIREPRLGSDDTRRRTARRRWGHLPALVIVHARKPHWGEEPGR